MYYLAIALFVVGRVMGIIWLRTLLEGAFFMAIYRQVVPPQKRKASPIWEILELGDDYCSSHQASSSQVRAPALVGLRFSLLASSRITAGGGGKNCWTRISLLLI